MQKCYAKGTVGVRIGGTEITDTRPRDARPLIIYSILSVILSGKRAFVVSRENNTGGKGSGRGVGRA